MRLYSSLLATLAVIFLFPGCTDDPGLVKIENEVLSVKISRLGAELQSIYGRDSKTEYLWQGDTAYWASRSPVMFPVNVCFRDDRFTYGGVTYEMPRVGLARILEFTELLSGGRTKAIFELRSGEEILIHYPFPFRFEVTYQLDGNRLINQFVVENTGTDTLYYATGGHPGFNCPLEGGCAHADYQYSFAGKLTLSHHKIMGGMVQPFMLPLLENEDFLNLSDPRVPADGTGMLVTDMPSRQISLGLAGKDPFVTVDLGDFPNVNLWAPPGMPYACIEPMVAHHDFADSPPAIEEKPHLVRLPAGESRTYRFTIIIHEEAEK